VEDYQYLVKATTANIAAKLPPHVDVEAMTQAAQFGLLEAVSKFEPDRGFQFATYARPRIFGAAMDELRNMDQVPRLTRIRSAKRQAAEHQLSQAMGRSPTEAEVADQLGCSETDIGDHQPVDTISLEAVVCHNRDDRVLKVGGTIEARASKCGLRTDHRCRHFSRLTRGLDFEARIVLYLHYLAGHTMAEVGRVMRISESRVSQVISQAVKFLRGARDKVEAWEELAEVQQHGGEEGE
jgi:RNA polymerase sigma factor for flagellar operon FliA